MQFSLHQDSLLLCVSYSRNARRSELPEAANSGVQESMRGAYRFRYPKENCTPPCGAKGNAGADSAQNKKGFRPVYRTERKPCCFR